MTDIEMADYLSQKYDLPISNLVKRKLNVREQLQEAEKSRNEIIIAPRRNNYARR